MKERMLDGSDKEVSEGRMPSQVRQAIEFGTSNGCRVELFESKHFLGMTDVIIDKFGGNNSNHLVECIRMTDNGDETFSVDNAYIAVNKDFIPIDGVPYEREAYVDEFANQAEFFENLGNSAAEAMLWQGMLWSRSFCLLTTGGATIDVIKGYIESQGNGVSDHRFAGHVKARKVTSL